MARLEGYFVKTKIPLSRKNIVRRGVKHGWAKSIIGGANFDLSMLLGLGVSFVHCFAPAELIRWFGFYPSVFISHVRLIFFDH